VFAYQAALDSGLALALCTANCDSTPTWTIVKGLETTDTLSTEISPILPTCNTTLNPIPSAYWYPGNHPSLGVIGDSAVAIAHQAKELEQCKPSGAVVDGPSLIRVRFVQ
jgi:hypothetical protein